ncbi:hypothetical protein JOE27_001692 [Pseudomonas sp. M5]|nr:hypothetical protein [Pseudomonas sp. M5]
MKTIRIYNYEILNFEPPPNNNLKHRTSPPRPCQRTNITLLLCTQLIGYTIINATIQNNEENLPKRIEYWVTAATSLRVNRLPQARRCM